MSDILNELAKLQNAAQEQTAASNTLSQEVAGKMGEIDQKVADSQKKFDDFVGGDFDLNVNQAKTFRIYIDPLYGNDENDGSSSNKSIQTSTRLNELASLDYDYVRLAVRQGSTFELFHQIKAKHQILVESWNANDGLTDKPIVKQSRADYCGLVAPEIYLNNCQVFTYQASENETMPATYVGRAVFGNAERLKMTFSKVEVYDNQLFHIHNAGSGDSLYRRQISAYYSSINAQASAAGVNGTQKRIFSWYGGKEALPLDLFGLSFGSSLNDEYASFRDFLNMTDTYIVTNINLDMA